SGNGLVEDWCVCVLRAMQSIKGMRATGLGRTVGCAEPKRAIQGCPHRTMAAAKVPPSRSLVRSPYLAVGQGLTVKSQFAKEVCGGHSRGAGIPEWPRQEVLRSSLALTGQA